MQMTDTVSGLRVQRDSAQHQLTRLDAENRWLRKHQADIRTWLAGAIQQWAAARKTENALTVADELIQRAADLLSDGETQGRP
jgi:hypothetical protein